MQQQQQKTQTSFLFENAAHFLFPTSGRSIHCPSNSRPNSYLDTELNSPKMLRRNGCKINAELLLQTFRRFPNFACFLANQCSNVMPFQAENDSVDHRGAPETEKEILRCRHAFSLKAGLLTSFFYGLLSCSASGYVQEVSTSFLL